MTGIMFMRTVYDNLAVLLLELGKCESIDYREHWTEAGGFGLSLC